MLLRDRREIRERGEEWGRGADETRIGRIRSREMAKVANWNPGVESVRASLARSTNAINSTRERDSLLDSRLGCFDPGLSPRCTLRSLLLLRTIRNVPSRPARLSHVPHFFPSRDTPSTPFFRRSLLLNSISPVGSISNEQYDEAPGGGVTSG